MKSRVMDVRAGNGAVRARNRGLWTPDSSTVPDFVRLSFSEACQETQMPRSVLFGKMGVKKPGVHSPRFRAQRRYFRDETEPIRPQPPKTNAVALDEGCAGGRATPEQRGAGSGAVLGVELCRGQGCAGAELLRVANAAPGTGARWGRAALEAGSRWGAKPLRNMAAPEQGDAGAELLRVARAAPRAALRWGGVGLRLMAGWSARNERC